MGEGESGRRRLRWDEGKRTEAELASPVSAGESSSGPARMGCCSKVGSGGFRDQPSRRRRVGEGQDMVRGRSLGALGCLGRAEAPGLAAFSLHHIESPDRWRQTFLPFLSYPITLSTFLPAVLLPLAPGGRCFKFEFELLSLGLNPGRASIGTHGAITEGSFAEHSCQRGLGGVRLENEVQW